MGRQRGRRAGHRVAVRSRRTGVDAALATSPELCAQRVRPVRAVVADPRRVERVSPLPPRGPRGDCVACSALRRTGGGSRSDPRSRVADRRNPVSLPPASGGVLEGQAACVRLALPLELPAASAAAARRGSARTAPGRCSVPPIPWKRFLEGMVPCSRPGRGSPAVCGQYRRLDPGMIDIILIQRNNHGGVHSVNRQTLMWWDAGSFSRPVSRLRSVTWP